MMVREIDNVTLINFHVKITKTKTSLYRKLTTTFLVLIFLLHVRSYAETLTPLQFHYQHQQKTAVNILKSLRLTTEQKNKKYFDSQIFGVSLTNENGLLKQDDPRTETIFNLIAPEGKGELGWRIGLFKLDGRESEYMAWAYFDPPVRQEIDGSRALLSLGVVKKVGSVNGSFELLNSLKASIKLKGNEELISFLWKTYHLGALGDVWGLETIEHGCGAGGSICATTFLRLFAVQQNKLTVVFNQAIAFYGNFAGEWNKNGTRKHTVVENIGTIIVKNERGEKIPTIDLKVNGQNQSRRFIPTVSTSGNYFYTTTDPQLITIVN